MTGVRLSVANESLIFGTSVIRGQSFYRPYQRGICCHLQVFAPIEFKPDLSRNRLTLCRPPLTPYFPPANESLIIKTPDKIKQTNIPRLIAL